LDAKGNPFGSIRKTFSAVELKDIRNDPSNSFLIGRILIGKLFAHELLFLVRFDPQTYEDKDESYHSSHVALLKDCS
jgi:hypothetical protein